MISLVLVIHPAVDPERLAALRAAAPEAEWINAADLDQAAAAMPRADALLGKITPELLALAPRLRWVQAFTASLEHYLFPALVEHPCQLTNTRGLFGDVIAEQVMGYILCFARNLHHYIRQQAGHRWAPVGGEGARVVNAAGPGTVNAIDRATIDLPGATLGIVGFGEIGRAIARQAGPFGMRVRGVDPHPEAVADPALAERVDPVEALPGFLTWSDFVVIAAPETPATRRLFDAAMLAHLRPQSYLINIGRGAIVVLDDLVAALRGGRLAGAALDVFETEPLPADHPLWDLPDVILTPHTAGYSRRVAPRHLAVLVENVRRFAAGQPLVNLADKRLGY